MKCVCPVNETVDRIKQDIAAKGIQFFIAVDQAKLSADGGIALRRSARSSSPRPYALIDANSRQSPANAVTRGRYMGRR